MRHLPSQGLLRNHLLINFAYLTTLRTTDARISLLSLRIMSLSGAAISRRVRGRVSLYDYSVNAILPALPLISDEWLPMRGSYPNYLTFDTTLVRPVVEIGRFTDSYFNANVNACQYATLRKLCLCAL